MDYNRSGIGWIAAAAALAGGVAYYFSKNGMRVRVTPCNEIAVDHTYELARVSPEQMITGAAVTVALGGLTLWALRRNHGGDTDTDTRDTWSSIQETEETIDVDVPVHVAYNQWTQFEEFPRFMPSVQEVRQIDDTHLHWRANVAGKTKEWDSEIVQQIPDQLIEWRSIGGVRNGGTVTFDKIREGRTRVRLRLWYEPQSKGERVGGLLGGVKLTAKGNLMRFKQLVQSRGQETGAWRGEVAPQH